MNTKLSFIVLFACIYIAQAFSIEQEHRILEDLLKAKAQVRSNDGAFDCNYSISASLSGQSIDVTTCLNGTIFWAYPYGAPAFIATKAPADQVYRVVISTFLGSPSTSVSIYELADPRVEPTKAILISYSSGSSKARPPIQSQIQAYTMNEIIYAKFKGPEQVGKFGTYVYY